MEQKSWSRDENTAECEKQAKAGCSLNFQHHRAVYGCDNLLFETIKTILIEDTDNIKVDGQVVVGTAVEVPIHQQCCIGTVFTD